MAPLAIRPTTPRNKDMKCTVQIDIDLPREQVIQLFDDPDNLAKWQKGLLSFEHLSGESAFPKQSMVYLRDFKNFAENGTDVRNQ